jgi:hypothetical protein
MSSLFEEADATADAMRKRPGFSEADLRLMFRHLQKRWHPTYADNQVRKPVRALAGSLSLQSRG